MSAQGALLSGGRLHLQHGPIDLIIGAEPVAARQVAFNAATARFAGLLEGLVAELPALRAPVTPDTLPPQGPVARRMHAAALPHSRSAFVTPMAAVAGAVADEILAAMVASTPLTRAYVNNGGDIALHLSPGAAFAVAMAHERGHDLGRIPLRHGDGIGGLATSGTGGRSLSLGIAESVTVLAADAAAADVAATLIANAVDLPGHPAIERLPAHHLDPDSDLGPRPVVTRVGALSADDCQCALDRGLNWADAMREAGLIAGAALFLRRARSISGAFSTIPQKVA